MSDVEGPKTIIEVRAGTEARWALVNPVLSPDETGWTTDTRRVKIGDGVTAWVDLPYAVETEMVQFVISDTNGDPVPGKRLRVIITPATNTVEDLIVEDL